MLWRHLWTYQISFRAYLGRQCLNTRQNGAFHVTGAQFHGDNFSTMAEFGRVSLNDRGQLSSFHTFITFTQRELRLITHRPLLIGGEEQLTHLQECFMVIDKDFNDVLLVHCCELTQLGHSLF